MFCHVLFAKINPLNDTKEQFSVKQIINNNCAKKIKYQNQLCLSSFLLLVNEVFPLIVIIYKVKCSYLLGGIWRDESRINVWQCTALSNSFPSVSCGSWDVYAWKPRYQEVEGVWMWVTHSCNQSCIRHLLPKQCMKLNWLHTPPFWKETSSMMFQNNYWTIIKHKFENFCWK